MLNGSRHSGVDTGVAKPDKTAQVATKGNNVLVLVLVAVLAAGATAALTAGVYLALEKNSSDNLQAPNMMRRT